jgi:pimeloyl-ACP methyl ester carboxylesterase
MRAWTRRTLTIAGERVVAHVSGDPSRGTLVGVHGLGSCGSDLRVLLEGISARGVLLDLPGFGESARPDRPYPVSAAVQAVLGTLDALGVARPVWVGCSYGAHVALRAALEHPARVAGLVLMSPGGIDPRIAPSAAEPFREEPMRARSSETVAVALDLLVGSDTPHTRAFRARRLALHTQPERPGGSDYRAVARSAWGSLSDDAAHRLEALAGRLHVEVLHGDRDPLVVPAVVRAAASRLGARLTTLPRVGHLPWLEDPAAAASCVRRALRASSSNLLPNAEIS